MLERGREVGHPLVSLLLVGLSSHTHNDNVQCKLFYFRDFSELQEKDGDRSQMLDQIEALEDQVTQARRKQIKLIEQAMNAQKEFGESLADLKNSKTSPQTRPLSAHGRYYRAADRGSHVGFISGYRSPREECRKILIETKGGQKVLKTYSDNAVQTKTVMEDFLANPEYEATLKRLKLSEQENKFLHDQLDEEKKKYQDLTQNKKMVAAMFERDILERDQRYADMQRKVKDKDRKFAMIAKEIQEREEVYIQHQEKYNDREQKFRSMQIELGEKDLVHGRLLQKVEEQEKMISDLQMKYQNAEKTSADLKQQVNSDWWRFFYDMCRKKITPPKVMQRRCGLLVNTMVCVKL